MGYGLVTCATYTYEVIKYADDDDISSVHDDYPEYIGLMFTGSFIACLFWVGNCTLYTHINTHTLVHTLISCLPESICQLLSVLYIFISNTHTHQFHRDSLLLYGHGMQMYGTQHILFQISLIVKIHTMSEIVIMYINNVYFQHLTLSKLHAFIMSTIIYQYSKEVLYNTLLYCSIVLSGGSAQ